MREPESGDWCERELAIHPAPGVAAEGRAQGMALPATSAIFYKSYDKQVERDDGEEGTESRRVLKAYAVFNADRCDDLPAVSPEACSGTG